MRRHTAPLVALLLAFATLVIPNSPLAGTPAQGAPDRCTARYMVFSLDRNGLARPLFHTLVNTSQPLRGGSLPVENRAGKGSSETVYFRVEDSTGNIVFSGWTAANFLLRGEFHGVPLPGGGRSIEPFSVLLDEAVFRILVPAPSPDRLKLTPGAATGIEQEFDLQEIASSVLPLSAAVPRRAREAAEAGGDPSNRLDILFMGDGYTSDQESKFGSDADSISESMLGISPYHDYKNFINSVKLFTPSEQSGADHPPYKSNCSQSDPTCCSDTAMKSEPLQGTMVDTAFDSRFCGWGIHRLLVADAGKLYAAAAAYPEWDSIVLIVNDQTYGGSGGMFSVVSLHTAAVEVAQHEFAHSFSGLGDEYESAYPGFPPCSDADPYSPCEPNITDQTERAAIKWSPWILPDTPVPTPESDPAYRQRIGLFEGGRYQDTGYYRPKQECLMRSLGKQFCEVCRQSFVLALYRGGWGAPSGGIDIIEPGSETPPTGDVSVSIPASIDFSVGILQPAGGDPIAFEWYLDGAKVDGATFRRWTWSPERPGVYSVEVRARDTTNLVNAAMAGELIESSRRWSVAATCGSFCATGTTTPPSGWPPFDVSFSGEAEGGEPPYSFSWNFGDGSPSVTGQNVAHTYTFLGRFTWTLTVSDSAGASAIDTGEIHFSMPCEISCDATVSSSATAGTSVSFSASAGTLGCYQPVTYHWDFGDGGSTSGQYASHVYLWPSVFVWTLTASADGVECTRSGSVTVVVDPPRIDSMKKATGPFRFVVTGSNLQKGISVFINGFPYADITWKNSGKLLIKGGKALKQVVPMNTPAEFRFVNPDGGEAAKIWQWP